MVLQKVRSHIQVSDEKHIYYAAREGEEETIILHNNSKHEAGSTSPEMQQIH